MLVLLACLVLGLSSALPAEDSPDTAYDESESLPCESTPVFSMAVPETVPQALAVWIRLSQPGRGSPARPGAQRPERGTFQAYSISTSFTIFDRALRC